KGESVRLASIFTEYDALQAILSFAKAGSERNQGLASDVTATLNWHRNWLFLGDSFPDWLPRVRLLFNASNAANRFETSRDASQIAVDRRFDWPEQALLDALGIQQFECDLAEFGAYFTKASSVRGDDERVDSHLDAVREILSVR
ncbi:MAG: hypothetical protein ITG02_05090, partial [Patulibacter sp.]|nr:hypothetical protein [Patulibacter sp.]